MTLFTCCMYIHKTSLLILYIFGMFGFYVYCIIRYQTYSTLGETN